MQFAAKPVNQSADSARASDTIIGTERLILREWREQDRAPMFAHVNESPAVTRWLGGLQTRESSDAGIDRCIACQAEHGHCFWALERRADDALLGFCGIKRVNGPCDPDRGSHEIGWRLREDSRGHGYAKEAAAASLSFAFDSLDADFVSAFTVDGNTASWGLMERLGMKRRPDLDYYDPAWSGDLGPGIVYRIRRDEWAVRRGGFA